jgi:hypothetical protein
MNCGRTLFESFMRLGSCLRKAVCCIFFVFSNLPASSQPVDCRDLAARINALGDSGQRYSNHYGDAVQKQRAELDRTIRYARSLGCNRNQFFLFDAPPPQCPGLNAQIQQMQANLAQGSGNAAGNAVARQQLIATYNAYCRGQAQSASQPRERGFFETLFSALNLPFGQQPGGDAVRAPPTEYVLPQPGEDLTPRGGSQAMCVRSCDGGFFPLSVPATQSDPDELTNLCRALCPNADVSVYTRSPNQDIMSAVSLDEDTPYSALPNALKFQKTFDPACTCKPAGQSWAEALAGAEQILGHLRKSDIVVTPENSDELSKPKFEKVQPPRIAHPPAAGASPANNNAASAKGQSPSPTEEGQGATEEVTGPDGVKRRVRIIVPPL